jgi:hypothetical protein
MKKMERNKQGAASSSALHSMSARLKEFFRAEAARYKETVIRSVPLSPLLPSEWGKCVRLIRGELYKARENVTYAAAGRTADPHTFEDCISVWGPTHVEVAAILLTVLSATVPRPEWKAMIAAEIESLTNAVEELARAEAGRDTPGGSAWHLCQARKQIEAALAAHVKLMAAMGIDLV